MKKHLTSAERSREIMARVESQRIRLGLSKKELYVYSHMCPATFLTRMKKPETWQIGEFKRLATVLKTTTTELWGEEI